MSCRNPFISKSSLVPQRHHGVNLCCATGRDISSKHRRSHEDHCSHRHLRGIVCVHSIEQTFDKASHCQSNAEPNRHPHREKEQHIPQHEPNHLFLLCAQRQANADFRATFCNRIGGNSVQSDCRKQQSQRTEPHGQKRHHSRLR